MTWYTQTWRLVPYKRWEESNFELRETHSFPIDKIKALPLEKLLI